MGPRNRALDAACRAVFAFEIFLMALLWAPLPLGWMWVGGRVFVATGSLTADLAVMFTGFVTTTILVMGWLVRIDAAWIELRKRAGYDQRQGALAQVVIVSATLALVAFHVWFYLEGAFILPFMPTQ